MSDKPSNNKYAKHIDKVDVDLKFDEDTHKDRTWAHKDKFHDFNKDYDDLQENSSLSNSSEVQFIVKTTCFTL